MMIRYDRTTENQVAHYGAIAECCFSFLFTNPSELERRLADGLKFMVHTGPETFNIDMLTNIGLFSKTLLYAMICDGKPFSPASVSILWDRMCGAGLIKQHFFEVNRNGLVDFRIDLVALRKHLQDRTFTNLFAHPFRLPEIYSHAIFAIDVRTHAGDDARGTGFVVSQNHHQYIVTCKHNVDPADGLTVQSIKSEKGVNLEFDTFRLSDNYDIAVAPLAHELDGPCFALSDDVEIFDEVYTLGYPIVPRALPVLVGHRGEINARARLYQEKCPALIISNLVSPGNSGCPVLLRDGHCVGMTSMWLENKPEEVEEIEGADVERKEAWKPKKQPFSAALPAPLIRDAINELR